MPTKAMGGDHMNRRRLSGLAGNRPGVQKWAQSGRLEVRVTYGVTF